VKESEGVAQLVNALGHDAAPEPDRIRLDDSVACQPGRRHDGGVSLELGFSEDEGQDGDEEVGIGEGEDPVRPGRPVLGKPMEDARGRMLAPARVEGPLGTERG
jgi:hypothetical protein